VSLLPFERREVVGGGRADVLPSLHTLLADGRGDAHDHARLLCALLLGFELDAYVAVGSVRARGGHLD
jgi:hypothetical protein